MIIQNSLLLILIAMPVGLGVVGLVFHKVSLQRERQEERISSLEQQLEQLAEKVTATHLDYDKRLTVVVKRNAQLLNRCRELEAQSISNRSYDNAIRMVKGGAKLGELVDMCGLSPGEAQLVANLHQKQTAG